ncbi:NADH:flavin oxidoreductase [Peptoniphilus sp. KCTC 25270]|uniref:NADH:flavin oxidoreductase n=1 Tax=Peptoniphilus sp. KCTC 25270 TaxID=2897414 RepID=UPI001E4C45E0|nr:NADH:flavin oxidoreductase [Peptoniphilus sp. KCTC 25270]MCD1146671.1 NADH:flavin oxidoreductase [Peptoniphilus sp. KCTC 25270]
MKEIRINKMVLKKPFVMPPMATEKSENGSVGEGMISYYKERAQNTNFGLIIVEHCFVAKDGMASVGQLSIAKDEDIAGLRKLTEAVHSANSEIKIFAQINHAGSKTTEEVTGEKVIGPSAYEGRGVGEILEEDRIRLKTAFVQGARRAKESGFDGVEIHSAHGYLLNQFYSPLRNYRKDEYGPDSIENRIRFLVEIYEEIRKEVGDTYPVAVRLGGKDYKEGGSTVEDAAKVAKILEAKGVDLLDITGGVTGYTVEGNQEPGWFGEISEAIKKEVSIPVLLTGGFKTKEQGEKFLEEEKADLIGIGRAFLKDAKWEMKE